MTRLPDAIRDDVLAARPTLWVNPDLRSGAAAFDALPVHPREVAEARANWRRLAPLLRRCFPELQAAGGAIASELIEADGLRVALGYGSEVFGRIFVKADCALPVAGSIKARGGVYEVMMTAERLARAHGLVGDGDDLAVLASDTARKLFSRHTISVGSTGNLGLSIGIAARALGFKAVVHMSFDAKLWKVERLERLGVTVVRHRADYTAAVESARADAAGDASVHFVDDERSKLLFLGYSAAAEELREQLLARGVAVDAEHPLFLHLPCGIGGAPGGVAYGARVAFGDAVHCFFAEPVQSPCALVHMASGAKDLVSVYDVGLTNRTEADGLAVARMSAFVAEVMRPLLSGIFTVADDDLFRWLALAWATQRFRLEPSATAGFAGPEFLMSTGAGRAYLDGHDVQGKSATHVFWATGGAFVPDAQFEAFCARGRR